MRKSLMVLIFVLFALPAFAQSNVNVAEATYLTAATMDWSSTLYALKQNRSDNPVRFTESNPLYAGLSDRPGLLFVVGESVDVGVVVVVHKLLKKQPKTLVTLLYVMSAIRFTVAVRNIQVTSITVQHSF